MDIASGIVVGFLLVLAGWIVYRFLKEKNEKKVDGG